MYKFDTKQDLRKFLEDEIINTADAAQILGCTRQNIDDLVRRNKLIPIKIFPRDKLFFKSDVLERVERKK